MKKVKIQQFLLDYAHDLTEKRVAINRERYAGTNKQRKGSINSHLLGEVSREYYTEYMGIIGELLTRYYYEITPSTPRTQPQHSSRTADLWPTM